MRIPEGAIAPLYLASFVMFAFQYFRLNPERRIRNFWFGLMVSMVVLVIATISLEDSPLSPVLFLLALFFLGLALYLFRYLPPPRH